MEKDEDVQIRETTTDVIIQELSDEKDNPTFIREYLKAEFLSSAIDALFYARRQANFTQAQVAEQLKTKQTAIARLEADTNGSLSLRRYVEFALTCGMVPLNITLVPIDSIRDFVMNHPDLPLTQELYSTWIKQKAEFVTTLRRASDNQLMMQAAIDTVKAHNTFFLNQESFQEKKTEAGYVQPFLKGQYSKQVDRTSQQGNSGEIMNTALSSPSLTLVQTTDSSAQSTTSLINKVAA